LTPYGRRGTTRNVIISRQETPFSLQEARTELLGNFPTKGLERVLLLLKGKVPVITKTVGTSLRDRKSGASSSQAGRTVPT